MAVLEKLFAPDEISIIKKQGYPHAARQYSVEELSGRSVYIYGCGVIGRKVSAKMAGRGVTVAGFVDRREQGLVDGLPVISLETLRTAAQLPPLVVISGRYARDMATACYTAGIEGIFPRQLPGPEMIAHASYPLTAEEVDTDEAWLYLYDLLADAVSRQTLKDILLYRLTLVPKFLARYGKHIDDQYFPEALVQHIDYSRFVDVGAYTGDTWLAWKQYCTASALNDTVYYGIEAFPEQYKELTKTVTGKNIHLFNNVISDTSNTIMYSPSGWGTEASFSSTASDIPATSLTLDDMLQGKCVSVIKADIEGDEAKLLRGASRTIHNCKPALVLSAYHRRNDLKDIPFMIAEMDKSYEIYLRHHNDSYTETVCYAL